MEGFDVPKIKLRPNDEPAMERGRPEKIREAEKSIFDEFNSKMRRDTMSPMTSFEYPRNLNV